MHAENRPYSAIYIGNNRIAHVLVSSLLAAAAPVLVGERRRKVHCLFELDLVLVGFVHGGVELGNFFCRVTVLVDDGTLDVVDEDGGVAGGLDLR